MEDEASRKTLGELAKARAKCFSTKRMAVSYVDLYKGMMRTGRKASRMEKEPTMKETMTDFGPAAPR
jgi:hypothetical protein